MAAEKKTKFRLRSADGREVEVTGARDESAARVEAMFKLHGDYGWRGDLAYLGSYAGAGLDLLEGP